jgi:hypothetical protein
MYVSNAMHSLKMILCLASIRVLRILKAMLRKTHLLLSPRGSQTQQVFNNNNGSLSFELSSVSSTKAKVNVRGKIHKKPQDQVFLPKL